MRILRADVRGEPRRIERERHRGPAGDRAVLELEAALGGVVQAVGLRPGGRLPGDHAAAQPVRTLHAAQRPRRVVADHVRGVIVRTGPPGAVMAMFAPPGAPPAP